MLLDKVVSGGEEPQVVLAADIALALGFGLFNEILFLALGVAVASEADGSDTSPALPGRCSAPASSWLLCQHCGGGPFARPALR